jgi:hypothetical protein
MEQNKLKEMNILALYLINELMRKKFEGLEIISFRDYTSENPTLGYSLGFSSSDFKATFTLYLFGGDTFPFTSDVFNRYHVSAVNDVLITNPGLGFKDETQKIEYFLRTDDMFGHLKTSLGSNPDFQDEHVIISAFFFGLLIKVRATLKQEQNYRQEIFLKDLFRNLSDVFLQLNQ